VRVVYAQHVLKRPRELERGAANSTPDVQRERLPLLSGEVPQRRAVLLTQLSAPGRETERLLRSCHGSTSVDAWGYALRLLHPEGL